MQPFIFCTRQFHNTGRCVSLSIPPSFSKLCILSLFKHCISIFKSNRQRNYLCLSRFYNTCNFTCCFSSILIIIKTDNNIIKRLNELNAISNISHSSLSTTLNRNGCPLLIKDFVDCHRITLPFGYSKILTTTSKELLSK